MLIFVIVAAALCGAHADVPRPRGVSLAKASLYHPQNDGDWVCLDGSKTIRFTQINDDYCDCADGSDEPGTAACPHGVFHCSNRGHRALDVPSSRVNDGICDCCDGSDEYAAEGLCSNNCEELGRVEQEQRRSEAELHKRGTAKRSEMIARGKQLRIERDARRDELKRRRDEQELIRVEKEQLKKNAVELESEALKMFREQQQQQSTPGEQFTETTTSNDTMSSLRAEAEAYFVRYDANKDGFVEVTELQVDMTLDKDRNGVVTVEEAKYYLDERERIDLDSFLTLSWPRIKPMLMLTEGLFKPPFEEWTPKEPEDEKETERREKEEKTNEDHTEFDHDHDHDHEEEEGEETYEEDDTEGVGTVIDERTPAPEYDPETQRIVELANEARNAFSEVEREIREIEHELKDIDEQNAKDYGAHDEYAVLDGECYKFDDREYVYTLCPFDRASQQQRSGGSETTLGRFDQWLPVGDNKYGRQKYAHGASCWNGPQRSVIVEFKCALETQLTAVSEPNRCEYFFNFETPAACDEAAFAAQEEEHLHLHDEL